MTKNNLNKLTNDTEPHNQTNDFNYFVEQFDDIRVLKYRLPDFENLSLQQKIYIYYLSQAAIAGRDILWDQNFKYNLHIRKIIEAVIESYQGDREIEEYGAFLLYAKKVFFANGIHHHYSSDKFIPGFTKNYFISLLKGSDLSKIGHGPGQNVNELAEKLIPVLFDTNLHARKVELKDGVDLISASASNFYEGVTQKEVEDYYSARTIINDPRPVSLGLNSRLIKSDGKVIEEVYCSGGRYGEAIDKIIFWLEKAVTVAESDACKQGLLLLIRFYKTGDLKIWDEYNIVWAGNTTTIVDYINGFIENYEDPMGMKATWESIVEYTDIEATKRSEIITGNAQWFEDNSPVTPHYRKENVTGVAAKVINVAMLGGDCYPSSPLGVNLPNADWIRKEVGSKSVTIANIADAYEITSQGNGFLEEFAFNQNEIDRHKKYGSLSDALHTDLHECVGHASGKLAEGTDPNGLRNYASALEEARADLFALYFMMDKKLSDLGLVPDEETAKTAYDTYMRNGLLTQLVRIKPDKEIEEAHMRCRSSITHWVFDKGIEERVVELVKRDKKTFVRINDYIKLRKLFGNMLMEVQRIKSEGDFEAGKKIIEDFGVKIDSELHSEVLARYAKLNLAPYTGFVNPMLIPVYDNGGSITDIVVEYIDDFPGQMMYYGKNHSFLTASFPVETQYKG